jgi:hypothetical protein
MSWRTSSTGKTIGRRMTKGNETRFKTSVQRVWLRIGIIVLLALLVGLALVGLRGRGLRTRARAAVSLCKAVLDRASVESNGDYTDVVFLHHSAGRNLIAQGGVRERLTEAGFRFWDHDYNREGLTRPDGTRAGYSYSIPDDNTDPDGFARVFSQRLFSRPLNSFSGLMEHDVIVFKSCFSVNHITSDSQLEQYRAHYLQMRQVMDQHLDHVFIIVTPPPLNPAASDAEASARARAFANWLKSDEFLLGHPNVFTFDFFDLLAEEAPLAPDLDMLRLEYRQGDDSHPSEQANRAIGPVFADFVVEVVETYRAEIVLSAE